MRREDETKTVAFSLWLKGRSIKQIEAAIRARPGAKPSSVSGWILDWERGRQMTWEPNITRE